MVEATQTMRLVGSVLEGIDEPDDQAKGHLVVRIWQEAYIMDDYFDQY